VHKSPHDAVFSDISMVMDITKVRWFKCRYYYSCTRGL